MWNPIIYPSGSPYKWLDKKPLCEEENYYEVPEYKESFSNYSDRLNYLNIVTSAIETVLGVDVPVYAQETEKIRIKEDLGADSLDIVDLSAEIEKELKISVPLYVLNSSSIEEIVDYITSVQGTRED